VSLVTEFERTEARTAPRVRSRRSEGTQARRNLTALPGGTHSLSSVASPRQARLCGDQSIAESIAGRNPVAWRRTRRAAGSIEGHAADVEFVEAGRGMQPTYGGGPDPQDLSDSTEIVTELPGRSRSGGSTRGYFATTRGFAVAPSSQLRCTGHASLRPSGSARCLLRSSVRCSVHRAAGNVRWPSPEPDNACRAWSSLRIAGPARIRQGGCHS
jgi:hypothetical protein